MILKDISGDKHQRLGCVSCKVLKGKWGKSCYSTGRRTPTRTLTWSRCVLEFFLVCFFPHWASWLLPASPTSAFYQVGYSHSEHDRDSKSRGFHQFLSFLHEIQALRVILLCSVQGLRLLPPCCCVILGVWLFAEGGSCPHGQPAGRGRGDGWAQAFAFL